MERSNPEKSSGTLKRTRNGTGYNGDMLSEVD